MKHVELICELMIAAHQGDVQNKKTAIDTLMRSKTDFTLRQVRTARAHTLTAINRLLTIFPNIEETRFRQLSDFYTLTVLVQKFEHEKLILTDKKRNRLAADLLTTLSVGVDELRHRARLFGGAREDETLYRDYAKTVSEGTDAIAQRRREKTCCEAC
jgi:hypothetical protein